MNGRVAAMAYVCRAIKNRPGHRANPSLAAWTDHDELSTAKIAIIFEVAKELAVNLPIICV